MEAAVSHILWPQTCPLTKGNLKNTTNFKAKIIDQMFLDCYGCEWIKIYIFKL